MVIGQSRKLPNIGNEKQFTIILRRPIYVWFLKIPLHPFFHDTNNVFTVALCFSWIPKVVPLKFPLMSKIPIG